jgi:hypothetical protein
MPLFSDQPMRHHGCARPSSPFRRRVSVSRHASPSCSGMVPVFTTRLMIAGRVTPWADVIDTPNGGHISQHRIALLEPISWLPKVRASSPQPFADKPAPVFAVGSCLQLFPVVSTFQQVAHHGVDLWRFLMTDWPCPIGLKPPLGTCVTVISYPRFRHSSPAFILPCRGLRQLSGGSFFHRKNHRNNSYKWKNHDTSEICSP